ncbi:hypothetical protein POM88_021182 [Heracleum sosnowskyi]|uniref:rRNA N-glycosylase n=1 Tax=Heracleum sosnowskyi TaxID=360622 RepID=A0AAD8MSK2_9APIA|nr:hypothetical protein POM88_021182 [Heracleum sosnowskyi]
MSKHLKIIQTFHLSPTLEDFDFTETQDSLKKCEGQGDIFANKIEEILKTYDLVVIDGVEYRKTFPPTHKFDPEDFVGMRFVVPGADDLYGVYYRRDLYLMALISGNKLYAMRGSQMTNKTFPDIGFQPLDMGFDYGSFSGIGKDSVCSSITTLSKGPYLKKSGANTDVSYGHSVGQLVILTSEAIRFHDIREFMRTSLNDCSYTPQKLTPDLLQLPNAWSKLSKVIWTDKEVILEG